MCPENAGCIAAATALLGRIIAKGTGMTLPDYARAALFDPAGIGPIEWINNMETWVTEKSAPETESRKRHRD